MGSGFAVSGHQLGFHQLDQCNDSVVSGQLDGKRCQRRRSGGEWSIGHHALAAASFAAGFPPSHFV